MWSIFPLSCVLKRIHSVAHVLRSLLLDVGYRRRAFVIGRSVGRSKKKDGFQRLPGGSGVKSVRWRSGDFAFAPKYFQRLPVEYVAQ